MIFSLLLFSSFILFVSFSPVLAPLWCVISIGLLSLAGIMSRHRWLTALGWAVAGIAYGMWAGHSYVNQQLPLSLSQQDYRIQGKVVGLPSKDQHRVRFLIDLESISPLGKSLKDEPQYPKRIQVSWYQEGLHKALPAIIPGDIWQMDVRLKAPRGFVNEYGFDYQAWLLRRGIGATGHVLRHSSPNHLSLSPANDIGSHISRARYQLREWIHSVTTSPVAPIAVALLIGDSSGLTPDIWEPMRQSGTSHLIAISGLHVGFVSLFGLWLGNLIGRVIHLLWHRVPACEVGWWSGMLFALGYSALAGFNIPTVRTLIMLCLFYGACLLRLHLSVWTIYVTALALVCILDPLCAFDMGFWLSFGAVFLLLLVFSSRYRSPQPHLGLTATRLSYWVVEFLRSQWVMLLGLALPLSLLVGSVSLLAPLANAIAIPVITFAVVPLLLVAASLVNVIPSFANNLVLLADLLLSYLVELLNFLLDVSGYFANPVFSLPLGFLPLVAIAVMVLLLPKGLLPRSLIVLTLLCVSVVVVFGVGQTKSPLTVDILDVGQGTAVIVSTPKHALVYDLGPRFTDEFDAGGGVIAPVLLGRGMRAIDRLVLSHKDTDHTGGLLGFVHKIHVDEIHAGDVTGIAAAFNDLLIYPRRLYAGLDPNQLRELPLHDCHSASSWVWEEVTFSYLSGSEETRRASNDKSCVLLISYRDNHVLLTGDMTKVVEQELLRRNLVPSNITLLLAGHHGSKTSSGYAWVSVTKPRYVIYSAAYQSRYGHPHPEVVERFSEAGSHAFSTATHGHIRARWERDGAMSIEGMRQLQQRYWYQ